MYRQIIVNDDNMKALAQFVGKQNKINIQILSYLEQLPVDLSGVSSYHLKEIKRLLEEMEEIRWQTI